MQQFVDGPAGEAGCVDAEQASCRGVGKTDKATAVNAADAVGYGVEQDLLLA